MGRFVVTVIDGFGIGAMEDCQKIRPSDVKANTCKSILETYKDLKLPTLTQMGLGNLVESHNRNIYPTSAICGRCALKHDGADTFMGHQEIMGSRPQHPIKQRLEESIEDVKSCLLNHGYQVVERYVDHFRYLIVNHVMVISDNIDSDLGQAINCIGALDLISFSSLLEIANIVRQHVTCNRVIAFGGTHVSINDIIAAEEIKENYYLGNVAVKTGVYNHGYEVRHLGYGVNTSVQVPHLLSKCHVPVTLIGKVADIVDNPDGKSINCVDSHKVLELVEDEIANMKNGFICANVQESDLAGHSMDVKWYMNILKICDYHFSHIIKQLNEDDIFVVCADHGNDPLIGHNRHTREYVPLLVYKKEGQPIYLGTRNSLADIGATVCDFFQTDMCEYGVSFLDKIQ